MCIFADAVQYLMGVSAEACSTSMYWFPPSLQLPILILPEQCDVNPQSVMQSISQSNFGSLVHYKLMDIEFFASK